ncbi:hypothetical protein ACFX2J_046123 [Malus domestica]
MSLHERAVINLFSQLALSYNGAALGVVLACAASRTVIKFAYTSSALLKLRNAPYVKVSGHRAILAPDESQPSDAKLVVLRGTVEAKSAVVGKWNSLKSGVFVSRGNKEQCRRRSKNQTARFGKSPGPLSAEMQAWKQVPSVGLESYRPVRWAETRVEPLGSKPGVILADLTVIRLVHWTN